MRCEQKVMFVIAKNTASRYDGKDKETLWRARFAALLIWWPPSAARTTGLLVRARNPRQFFQQLTTLVLEEHFEMRHLETLDESTHAVLGYLLGKRGG